MEDESVNRFAWTVLVVAVCASVALGVSMSISYFWDGVPGEEQVFQSIDSVFFGQQATSLTDAGLLDLPSRDADYGTKRDVPAGDATVTYERLPEFDGVRESNGFRFVRLMNVTTTDDLSSVKEAVYNDFVGLDGADIRRSGILTAVPYNRTWTVNEETGGGVYEVCGGDKDNVTACSFVDNKTSRQVVRWSTEYEWKEEYQFSKSGWTVVQFWAERTPSLGRSSVDVVPVIGEARFEKEDWWNETFLKAQNYTLTNLNDSIFMNYEAFRIQFVPTTKPVSCEDEVRVVDENGTVLRFHIFNLTYSSGLCQSATLAPFVNISAGASQEVTVYYNASVSENSYREAWLGGGGWGEEVNVRCDGASCRWGGWNVSTIDYVEVCVNTSDSCSSGTRPPEYDITERTFVDIRGQTVATVLTKNLTEPLGYDDVTFTWKRFGNNNQKSLKFYDSSYSLILDYDMDVNVPATWGNTTITDADLSDTMHIEMFLEGVTGNWMAVDRMFVGDGGLQSNIVSYDRNRTGFGTAYLSAASGAEQDVPNNAIFIAGTNHTYLGSPGAFVLEDDNTWSANPTENVSFEIQAYVEGFGSMDNVTFEYGGSNYTVATVPAVQNSSGSWFINFTPLGAGSNFSKWYAITYDNAENSTENGLVIITSSAVPTYDDNRTYNGTTLITNSKVADSLNISFDVGYSDDNFEACTFEWDGVNYSAPSATLYIDNTSARCYSNITSDVQTTGSHLYAWYFNDTLGNENSTGIIPFEITSGLGAPAAAENSPVFETNWTVLNFTVVLEGGDVDNVTAHLFWNGTNESFDLYQNSSGTLSFSVNKTVPFVETNYTNVTTYWWWTSTLKNGTYEESNTSSVNQSIFLGYHTFGTAINGGDTSRTEGDNVTVNVSFTPEVQLANVSGVLYYEDGGVQKALNQLNYSHYDNWLAIVAGSPQTINSSVNVSYDGVGWKLFNTSVGITVGEITVAGCNATFNETFLVIDTYQENSTDVMNEDPNVDITLNAFSGSELTNYSFGFSGNTTYTICVDPTDTATVTNATIQYWASSYPQRTYYLYSLNLTNDTQLVDLYSLHEDDADLMSITVKDSNAQFYKNAIIKVQRYYPSTNEYLTIGIWKTDTTGSTPAYLDLHDVFYKFIIEDGSSLEVQLNTEASLLTSSSIELSTVGETLSEYFQIINGVSVDCTYTNSTLTVECTWSDSSNVVETMCLRVEKIATLDTETLSDVCASTASGTLGYTLTDTDFSYSYMLYGDTTFEASIWEYRYVLDYIEFSRGQPFGIDGVFIALFMLLTVVGIGLKDPRMAMIMSAFFIGVMLALGLMDIGIVATVSLVAVAVIMIWRMKA